MTKFITAITSVLCNEWPLTTKPASKILKQEQFVKTAEAVLSTSDSSNKIMCEYSNMLS